MGVLLTDTVAVSVSAGDLNGDGWPDLFVNTRTSPQGQKQDRGNGPNQLYLHDGKGPTPNALRREVSPRGQHWVSGHGFRCGQRW